MGKDQSGERKSCLYIISMREKRISGHKILTFKSLKRVS